MLPLHQRGVGRRGLNPHVPLPFPLLIRERGYAPVGHLGVEPSATALSGRPLRPAGSWPAEGGGVEPRAPCGTPLAFKASCRAGGAPSKRKTEDPNPCGCPLTRFRAGDRLHGGFIFHERRTEIPTPSAVSAHTVSSRSRHPGRFILQSGRRSTRSPRCDPRIA